MCLCNHDGDASDNVQACAWYWYQGFGGMVGEGGDEGKILERWELMQVAMGPGLSVEGLCYLYGATVRGVVSASFEVPEVS